MKEIDSESIKEKFSGKFSELYPVYVKLKNNVLDKIGEEIKIFLKTIYLRVDFDNGTFGVIFWKNGTLDFVLPLHTQSNRLVCAKKYGYKNMPYMLQLRSVTDIDPFVYELLKQANSEI